MLPKVSRRSILSTTYMGLLDSRSLKETGQQICRTRSGESIVTEPISSSLPHKLQGTQDCILDKGYITSQMNDLNSQVDAGRT